MIVIIVVVCVIFLPAVKDADEPHQDHGAHVGLEFLYHNLHPARKLLTSHALQCKLIALVDDVLHQGGCKNREKILSGEDEISTFGPAFHWKGEMLMPLSCDEKFPLALHIERKLILLLCMK